MTAPRDEGVYFENGVWVAWFNGGEVAAGPDKAIIEAAYEWHVEDRAQQYAEDDGGGFGDYGSPTTRDRVLKAIGPMDDGGDDPQGESHGN